MLERARWCIRNPGACAEVAKDSAGQRIQSVRERFHRERPEPQPRSEPRPEPESEPVHEQSQSHEQSHEQYQAREREREERRAPRREAAPDRIRLPGGVEAGETARPRQRMDHEPEPEPETYQQTVERRERKIRERAEKAQRVDKPHTEQQSYDNVAGLHIPADKKRGIAYQERFFNKGGYIRQKVAHPGYDYEETYYGETESDESKQKWSQWQKQADPDQRRSKVNDDFREGKAAYDRIAEGKGTEEDFRFFGVEPGTPADAVKPKYRKWAKTTHPDRNEEYTKADPRASEWRQKNPAPEPEYDVKTYTETKHAEPFYADATIRYHGMRDNRAEVDKMNRRRTSFVEEYCTEFPEKCKQTRMDVETHGFCKVFPDKCKDPIFANPYSDEISGEGGMKRRNDFMHAENVEKKKRKELSEAKFLLSPLGRAATTMEGVISGTYYEARDVSNIVVGKKAKKLFEVAESRKYVPTYKKPKKLKKRTPRRYRMNVTNAMDDVDSEMSRAMGWYM